LTESDNHLKSFEPLGPLDEELKKLLQDPDFKDRFLAVVKQLEPEKGRELARVLLWNDAVFSFGLAGQIPLGLNFFVAFLDQLFKELQNVPPELMRAFTTEMVRNVDFEAIKALPQEGLKVIRDSNLPELIKPEDLAALSNAIIAAYNHGPRAGNQSGSDAIKVYLENLDQDQFSKALQTASGGFSRTLAENPVLARSLFKALVKITCGTLRGLLRRTPKAERKDL
jgi:hypothetical protein